MRNDYDRVLREAHEKRAEYVAKTLRTKLSAIRVAAARASAALVRPWRTDRRPASA